MSAQQFKTLDQIPRANLMRDKTPFEPMQRITDTLGGTPLWVKRDDIGPLAFGGNKLRQLEYYFGAAQAEGADTVLITGAVQSNFVRLAAASACYLGMQCHIQLEERVSKDDVLYRQSGNVLLDKILGAHLHSYPAGEDEAGADRNLEAIASELESRGQKPFVIHLGPGHPSLGALGYVQAAMELHEQCSENGITPAEVIVPSGSGATHAGMLFGMKVLNPKLRVIGICVRRDAGAQRERIKLHCNSMAELLGIENPVNDADIYLDDGFLAPGYGVPGEKAQQAIRLAARLEGIIVDPVYSAKSLAGAIHRAQQGSPEQLPIVYIHTGGLPAIFAYAKEMLNAVGEAQD